MFFDTHAHYDDRRYDGDRDELLRAVHSGGVDCILNAGSGIEESAAGLRLADEYGFIYASVGVHPHEAAEMDGASAGVLRKMLEHGKAVAVGEIGLDYYYEHSPREVQRERLREQLCLARETRKPVIIHERDAFADVMGILEDFRDLSCVFHCFSGDRAAAKPVLDRGWFLSFTGVVTFRGNAAIDAAAYAPLDRIMLETDAPYLSPHPRRGKRNDSRYLEYIAAAIARARGMDAEELARAAAANGLRFFGIESIGK